MKIDFNAPFGLSTEMKEFYEKRAKIKLKEILKESISKKILEAFDSIIEEMAEEILKKYDIKWFLQYNSENKEDGYLVAKFVAKNKDERLL